MEKEKEGPVKGQCNKDSDCPTGYVCVNGKCVQDIAAQPQSKDEDNDI